MTEMLLQKLEEKMMLLLSEVEDLRKEVIYLRQDGSHLRAEKENHSKKLSDLLGLLDAVNLVDQAAANVNALAHPTAIKPVSLQSISSLDRQEHEYA